MDRWFVGGQSKFSAEELEVRGQMVAQMQAEIQELKELSLAGYVRGYNGNKGGLIVTMEESEAFKGPLGKLHTGKTDEAPRAPWGAAVAAGERGRGGSRLVYPVCLQDRSPPALKWTQV